MTKGFFAGVGEQALSIADFPAYDTRIGEAIGPEERRPFRGVEDVPVLGPVTRSWYTSRPRDQMVEDMSERFYRYYRESDRIVSTVNNMIRNDDTDQAIRYAGERPDRLLLYNYHGIFQKIATALSQLRNQRTAIVTDASIPEVERVEQARKIYQKQLEIMYIAEGIHRKILATRGVPEEGPQEGPGQGPLGTPPPRLMQPPPQ